MAKDYEVDKDLGDENEDFEDDFDTEPSLCDDRGFHSPSYYTSKTCDDCWESPEDDE